MQVEPFVFLDELGEARQDVDQRVVLRSVVMVRPKRAEGFGVLPVFEDAQPRLGGGIGVLDALGERARDASIELGARLGIVFDLRTLAQEHDQVFVASRAVVDAAKRIEDFDVPRVELERLLIVLGSAIEVLQLGVGDPPHARVDDGALLGRNHLAAVGQGVDQAWQVAGPAVDPLHAIQRVEVLRVGVENVRADGECTLVIAHAVFERIGEQREQANPLGAGRGLDALFEQRERQRVLVGEQQHVTQCVSHVGVLVSNLSKRLERTHRGGGVLPMISMHFAEAPEVLGFDRGIGGRQHLALELRHERVPVTFLLQQAPQILGSVAIGRVERDDGFPSADCRVDVGQLVFAQAGRLGELGFAFTTGDAGDARGREQQVAQAAMIRPCTKVLFDDLHGFGVVGLELEKLACASDRLGRLPTRPQPRHHLPEVRSSPLTRQTGDRDLDRP